MGTKSTKHGRDDHKKSNSINKWMAKFNGNL